MALTSPRFSDVPDLIQADANAPFMSSGARGHGVHVLQFALIDLGFPMPGSTGGKGMSPDGIFGSETKARVKEFQRSALGGAPVTDDGVVGHNTMTKLDKAIGGFTHTVAVTIYTESPSAQSVFLMVAEAKKIYAHYGINFEVRWGRCLAVKEPHKTTLYTKAPAWGRSEEGGHRRRRRHSRPAPDHGDPALAHPAGRCLRADQLRGRCGDRPASGRRPDLDPRARGRPCPPHPGLGP